MLLSSVVIVKMVYLKVPKLGLHLPLYIIWRSFRCCFPCRSNESKAYPLILGDDVFDIYCNMAVAPAENDACGVGGWTLVMKISGTKVYLFQHSPFRLLNQETDETKNFFLFVSNRYIYDENSNNTTFYCFYSKVYCYMAGNFFPAGYFDVTWHLTMKLFPAKISERVTLQSLWRQRVTVVVYLPFTKISGKSGWKVNGTRPFRSSQRKISGSDGTSEKVVLFFPMEYSKQKFVFHFFKAIIGISLTTLRPFSGKRNWFVLW